jgi:hypothetical protein
MVIKNSKYKMSLGIIFPNCFCNAGKIGQCMLHTVKPVLRGHLWDKKKWSYKTGDLFKEV